MFFTRIQNGWELAKESWQVLKLDKELLLFPVLSGLACLLVMASFALPMMGSDMVRELEQGHQEQVDPLLIVIAFAFYFANYFVITYFNTALIGCAIIRFRGGDPTVSDGFRTATSRLPQIVGWALVAATVGLILRIIEQSSERAGQIIAGLVGMAWTAVSYFVVPVIVVEGLGPGGALKRSFGILKESWGESLIANWSIGLITMLAGLLAIVPIGLGVSSGEPALMALGIGLGVLWILLISLISTALNAIVIGAIYLYATDGEVPEQFDRDLLQSAFVAR